MKIYIITPAYNEEERITKTLEEYKDTVIRKYKNDVEIIVVSESTDRTNSIVSNYASKYKQIKLLASTKIKFGKGGAIVKGFALACKDSDADIIGFSDADPSISGQEIVKLIEQLKKRQVDGVVASRYVKGSKIIGKQRLTRFVASRAYNIMIRILFGLKFYDTQCGAKFFKKKALCSLVEHLSLTDMSFDLDLLYEMQKRGFRIIEVPIRYNMIYEGTKLRLKKQIPQMFMVAIGFRLKHSRFNKYFSPKLKGFVYNAIRKW